MVIRVIIVATASLVGYDYIEVANRLIAGSNDHVPILGSRMFDMTFQAEARRSHRTESFHSIRELRERGFRALGPTDSIRRLVTRIGKYAILLCCRWRRDNDTDVLYTHYQTKRLDDIAGCFGISIVIFYYYVYRQAKNVILRHHGNSLCNMQ